MSATYPIQTAHAADLSAHTSAAAPHSGHELTANKDANGGYVGRDANGGASIPGQFRGGNAFPVFFSAPDAQIPIEPSGGWASRTMANYRNVLSFDDSTDEKADFLGVLPGSYNGGGLTVRLLWTCCGGSGNVVWTAAFERLIAGLNPLLDAFDTAQSVTSALDGGNLVLATLTFTDAQIAGLLPGEAFRLRVARDADHPADSALGDMKIYQIILEENL